MTDWNNYSMQKPVPFGPIVQPTAPTPAPTNSAPQMQGGPFGFLNNLFGGLPGQQGNQFGGLGAIGGLLGSLLNRNQPAPAKPTTVIDKRPDDVQRLVSMYSNPNGGQ